MIVNGDVVSFHYVADRLELQANEVFVWDLDKTYLDTPLESLRGLVKTAIEKAFQKRNIPGTAVLVRALRNSWRELGQSRQDFPIYFITASPPQLEKRIHGKLNLDGIYPYGIFFKDNLKNLRPSRWWRLNQQIGYKLYALLQLRMRLKPAVKQIMWGDDSESDAVIYSLYSDLCTRRFKPDEFRQILTKLKVTPEQTEMILDLQTTLPSNDPVEKIYINLAEDTDAEYYLKFGRRTVPTYNSFQTALDLYQDNRLGIDQVVKVAQDLMSNYGFTQEELVFSFDDLIRRPLLADTTVQTLVPTLIDNGVLNKNYHPAYEPKPMTREANGRVFELQGHLEPWVPEQVDYFHDYR